MLWRKQGREEGARAEEGPVFKREDEGDPSEVVAFEQRCDEVRRAHLQRGDSPSGGPAGREVGAAGADGGGSEEKAQAQGQCGGLHIKGAAGVTVAAQLTVREGVFLSYTGAHVVTIVPLHAADGGRDLAALLPLTLKGDQAPRDVEASRSSQKQGNAFLTPPEREAAPPIPQHLLIPARPIANRPQFRFKPTGLQQPPETRTRVRWELQPPHVVRTSQ